MKHLLMEETGLTADLCVAGFYHKMDYDTGTGDLLEDKVFVLVYGANARGELIVDDEGHHNEWLSDEDLVQRGTVFESVPEITAIAKSNATGTTDFMEGRYEYRSDEY